MIKKPLISVIIPVYNVEKYLRETIENIANQDIGFTKNVELIIVNDGSTDGSEKISKEFVDRYPNNIIYIKQKNSGVSAARNRGLGEARGKYIHFMDGDDLISKNFYRESAKFLDNHKGVDLVASKIMYFDAKFATHYLNWKFKQNRIIDVLEEPGASLYHVPTTLIRRKSIGETRFDKRLVVTEDAKFLSNLLLNKKKYGVLKSTTYLYRSRKSENSAISGKLGNRKYFINTPTMALGHILRDWTDERGDILDYAQNLVMNDIAWKIKEEKKQSVLNDKEELRYKSDIYDLIKRIDDHVIVKNSLLDLAHKIFLLKKKYGNTLYGKKVVYGDGEYTIDGVKIASTASGLGGISAVYDFIKRDGNKVSLEGFITSGIIKPGDSLYIKTSKGRFDIYNVERPHQRDSFLGDYFFEEVGFRSSIEVLENDKIQFIYSMSDGKEFVVPVSARQFTGMSMLNGSYTNKGDLAFVNKRQYIEAKAPGFWGRVLLEFRFCARVILNLQLKRSLAWFVENTRTFTVMLRHSSKRYFISEQLSPFALVLRSFMAGITDVFIRALFHAGLFKSSKPIWIVSDRGTVAGDNGEALFKYIYQNEKPDADVYFAISRKSTDYKRLKSYGKTLDTDGFKYKMLFLRSRFIISSAADYYVYNAFGYRWNHFIDLYKFDFVFLQHGIIKDDLSSWLNRFEKNIRLFVTSSKKEYDSVVNGNYSYDKDRVLLSGLPRYDYLRSRPEGVLMLAPTWRHNILDEARHHKTGIRKKSDDFKNTEYYKFYNGLMNDTRILNALQNNNMKGELYLHPAFSVQAPDFIQNDLFVVKKMPYDYKEAFSESDILVTDYSSVAFDFAYLKKPVIYTQFDKETLYLDHIYDEGYFSYEADGFGPVAYDYESSVELVVSAINNRSMRAKYAKRVDEFFEYTDMNNSKRVYRAINSIKESNT